MPVSFFPLGFVDLKLRREERGTKKEKGWSWWWRRGFLLFTVAFGEEEQERGCWVGGGAPGGVCGGRVAAVFILSSSVASQVYIQGNRRQLDQRQQKQRLIIICSGPLICREHDVASIPFQFPFWSGFFRYRPPRSVLRVVSCGWFLAIHLLLVAACSQPKAAASQAAAGPRWPLLLSLSLFSLFLRSFSRCLFLTGEKAAIGGGVLGGVRREQDCCFRNTHLASLSLPPNSPGRRLRVRGKHVRPVNQAPLFN